MMALDPKLSNAFALLILVVLTVLTGCRPTQPGTPTPLPEGLLETIVAATLTAAAPPPASPETPTVPPPASPTPAPPTATITSTPNPAGNVRGRICFPGESIPAMTAYFLPEEGEAFSELSIQENQTSYEISLLPGKYVAFAWLNDFSRGGLYSQAVLCGMSIDCKDHKQVVFSVDQAENVEGIDLCDWYAGPFNIPSPPGVEQDQVSGTILGAIGYPSGSAPALHVVAFNQETFYWYFTRILPGADSYAISGLPPGSYQVVAYPEEGSPGGVAGSDHNLREIAVRAGEVSQADILDWNAPTGSFPPDPTRE